MLLPYEPVTLLLLEHPGVMGMDAREAGGLWIHMKGTVTGLVKGEGAVYRTPASRS